MQYHAVMLDETGCEFGHTFEAPDRNAAWDYLMENYPESRCIQLEDPTDTAERQARIDAWAARAYDDPDYDYHYYEDQY